jgi:hypothetical protein
MRLSFLLLFDPVNGHLRTGRNSADIVLAALMVRFSVVAGQLLVMIDPFSYQSRN